MEVEAFNCLICLDSRPIKEIFQPNKSTTCSHSFCTDCISKHIDAKVQQNILIVECPDVDCEEVVDFDSCTSIIPKDVLDRWEEVLSKAEISSITSLYCPFKECSAALVPAAYQTAMAECPHCQRKFCTECNVAWHEGIECAEFEKLGDHEKANEDIMLRNLAKDKLWARCPNCKFYVERTQGCRHIVCRCRSEFCYGCGSDFKICGGVCG